MLTGAMFRKRALAVVALALPAHTVLAALAMSDVAAAAPGRTCAVETHMWTGTAVLDAATSGVITDLIVPAVAGTDLAVVGVSADGLTVEGVARPMSVTVGDVPAIVGATVPGGAVTIVGDGAAAEVRGVTVVVDRCTVVESVAPVPPADRPPSLPRTGVQLDSSLFGALAVAIGSAMIVMGRRRSTSVDAA